MGYTERQEQLRAEAMRVTPGVMAAKARGDLQGAVALVEGYRQTATGLGITDGNAWSILWSATLHWTMELADSLARSRDLPMETLLQGLGVSALEWMAEGGVGGY